MVDDCAEFPEWQKKIQDELGEAVNRLFIQFDESQRDAYVQRSEFYRRFDMEKQRFFK